jgi:hypothetical protein
MEMEFETGILGIGAEMGIIEFELGTETGTETEGEMEGGMEGIEREMGIEEG